MDTQKHTSPQTLVASILLRIVFATAVPSAVALTGCKKSAAQVENLAQPAPPETEHNDSGPSDEIIKRFPFISKAEKFKRGSTLISKGGNGISEGTLLFPVRPDPDPDNGWMTYYFFRDEFGDWKCLWEREISNGPNRVQILKPH